MSVADPQVVEVFCDTTPPDRGSGYLIAGGMVLTARHVVAEAPTPSMVRVRRATQDGEDDWLHATEIVLPADPDLDVAVIRLAAVDAETADTTPDVGIIDVDDTFAFSASGFPRAQREGESREVEQARGVTGGATGARRGLLALNVDTAAPPPVSAQGGRISQWSGLSGAAVFLPGRLLVGVVVNDHTDYDGRRLEAVPVPTLTDDANLGRVLPQSWHGSGRQRMSNLLTFSLGPGIALHLESPYTPLGPQARARLRTSHTEPLRAKHQVVPFTARTAQRETLTRWCLADPAPFSVALLSGPGGSGKTRLARQLCQDAIESGWIAGTLGLSTVSPQAHLADLGRPLLVVLDYVDHQADFVAEIIERCVDTSSARPIRLLVLARAADPFLRQLQAVLGPADSEVAADVRLGVAELTPADKSEHYRTAVAAFRRLRGLAPPERPDAPPEPDLSGLPTPLLVHARALLDVLAEPGEGEPTSATSAEDLFTWLITRENRKFWRPALAEIRTDLPTQAIFAAATFAGAETRDEAVTLLAGLPGLADASADLRGRIVDRLHEQFAESTFLPKIEPDLLGEQLIEAALMTDGAALRVFAVADRPAQRSRMLEVLLRMRAGVSPAARASAERTLATLLTTQLRDLVAQANRSEQSASGSDEYLLPARLAAALHQVEVAQAAVDAVPVGGFARQTRLQPLAAVLYQQAAEQLRATGEIERAAQMKLEAVSAYVNLNRPEAAAGQAGEALSYLSRLPALSKNPYLSKIMASNALIRVETGNVPGAVTAAEEAVELARQAARDEPERGQLQLAEAQRMLAMTYFAHVDMARANQAAAEAVRVAEGLGPREQARALLVRASTGMLLGDLDLASDCAGQARELLARVAAETEPGDADPSVWSELASATVLLAQFAAVEGDVGRAAGLVEKAVAVADAMSPPQAEATRLARAVARFSGGSVLATFDAQAAFIQVNEARNLLRELNREYPDIYGFYYVMSEIGYAELLNDLGRGDEAARASRYAEALAEQLYQHRPRLYLTLVTMAARAKAVVLEALGDRSAAISALDEAIARAQRVDAPGSAAMLGQLQLGLSMVHVEHDEYAAALTAARGAAEVYGRLDEADLAMFAQPLIVAKLMVMNCAARCDLAEEADAAALDAMRLAHRLVEQVPGDVSRRVLVLTMVEQARLHRGRGRVHGAIDLLRMAVGLYDQIDPLLPGDLDDLAALQLELDESLSEIGPALPGQRRRQPDELSALSVPNAQPHQVTLGRLDGQLIAAGRFRPILVIGPQRSGKTTGVVIPTLLEWDGPALVTSVRTDVVSGTLRNRRRVGEVSIFEPAGQLMHGPAVTSWNPLQDCLTWDGAVVTARWLTEAARVGGDSGLRDDKFWYTMATQLLQPLLFAAAVTGLTMAEVSRWVKSFENAEVRARLAVGRNQQAIKTFDGIRALAEITMTSIYATAASILAAYDSEEVQAAAKTGFDIGRFFDGRANTLYLCAPPDEQELLAPIFTALIRRVIAEAYRRQAKNEKIRPLLLLLDEAGNIARIENLDTVATTAAGTEIQLVTVFHDLAQMESLYKPERAHSIANNHSARLLLPGNSDPRTGDFVRQLIAEEPVAKLRNRSIRRLAPGTALCLYEHLGVDVIDLRSSFNDEDLRVLAGAPPVGEPDTFADLADLVTFGRRPAQ